MALTRQAADNFCRHRCFVFRMRTVAVIIGDPYLKARVVSIYGVYTVGSCVALLTERIRIKADFNRSKYLKP